MKISTIQISQSTKDRLKSLALTPGESYENIIIRLLNNSHEELAVEHVQSSRNMFRFKLDNIVSDFDLVSSKKQSKKFDSLIIVSNFKFEVIDTENKEICKIEGYVQIDEECRSIPYTKTNSGFIKGIIPGKNQSYPMQGFIESHFRDEIDIGILALESLNKENIEKCDKFIKEFQ